MLKKQLNIAVFSSGLFGTALTVPLSENVKTIYLHFRSLEQCKDFEHTRENRARFPGIKLPINVQGFHNPDDLDRIDGIILALPTRVLREALPSIRPLITKNTLTIVCSKGVEEQTCLRPSQVLKEVNPNLRNVAVLSGPNYAHGIIRSLPTLTVIASEKERVAKMAQGLFRTNKFMSYITDDVVGVELGGALKNLIAIAVGIADGMEMGSNGSAALMNRAIKEATRLVVVLGGDERTMAGLAGAADTVLSSKRPGRNYIAGYEIGQGADPDSLKNSGKTIESLDSIRPMVMLARKYDVEVPILETLLKIIEKEIKPYEAIDILMSNGNLYEDPQPVIDRRLKLPFRFLNKILHPWHNGR